MRTGFNSTANYGSPDQPVSIAPNDASADAFGRIKVSEPRQRLDVEFLYDKQPEFFDEVTNGASASVTWNSGTRDLTLTAGSTTNGEYAKMSSYPVPYTPGNSQEITMTGVLNLANIASGSCEVFLRSNISGTPTDLNVIAQEDWINNQPDADWSKSHIFAFDFQSLKVGRIRFALDVSGHLIKVAEIINDNIRDSGYWQLANLPVLYRVYNTDTETLMEIGYGDENNAIGFRYRVPVNASATMKAICCTVKSSDSALLDIPGVPRSVDLGQTTRTVSTTLLPIISIRPKTTFQGQPNMVISIPDGASINSDEPVRYVIVHGATLTGASWADVDSDRSTMEYDISATSMSGGHETYSEYVYAGGQGQNRVGGSGSGLLGKTVLWNRQDGESGILTLAAIRTSANNASVYASIQWRELR